MFTPTDSQLKATNKRIKDFIDDYSGDEIFSSKISVVSLRADVLERISKNLQSAEYSKVLLSTYPNTTSVANKVLGIFKKKFKVAHSKITNSDFEYQDNLVIYIFPK